MIVAGWHEPGDPAAWVRELRGASVAAYLPVIFVGLPTDDVPAERLWVLGAVDLGPAQP